MCCPASWGRGCWLLQATDSQEATAAHPKPLRPTHGEKNWKKEHPEIKIMILLLKMSVKKSTQDTMPIN